MTHPPPIVTRMDDPLVLKTRQGQKYQTLRDIIYERPLEEDYEKSNGNLLVCTLHCYVMFDEMDNSLSDG